MEFSTLEVRWLAESTELSPGSMARQRRPRRIGIWAAGVTAAVLVVCAGAAIPPMVRESHKNQCRDRLKRLGLALQEYHEQHNHFPAAAITDKSGKPLLSWRVAILPQLGYRSLHDRFHLDEPWDSPHNPRSWPRCPRSSPARAWPTAGGS